MCNPTSATTRLKATTTRIFLLCIPYPPLNLFFVYVSCLCSRVYALLSLRSEKATRMFGRGAGASHPLVCREHLVDRCSHFSIWPLFLPSTSFIVLLGSLELIKSLYVPAIYKHLDVTVKITGDRVYFVRGEVKQPGRLIYVGSITVTKAITSAGDFTDFANRKKILLIRTSGQRFKLNADAILNGEAPDPPVYPGDQIEVKRRVF